MKASVCIPPQVDDDWDDDRLARQLAALAHPSRLEILRWMACRDDCRCKDVVSAMPLAQSTVSQHLKVLAEAGLVRLEGRRPNSSYGLDHQALASLAATLSAFSELCCTQRGQRDTEPDRTHV